MLSRSTSPILPVLGVLLLLSSACGGGGGSSKALELLSVSPETGSANTIWTLTGGTFSRDLEENVVRFDGARAMVLALTTSGALQVTGAFPPVTEAETKSVTVQLGSRISNPIAITAVPTGTIQPFGLDRKIFGRVDSLHFAGESLVVVDRGRGAFRQDLASGEITPIALDGENGVQNVRGVFLGRDGEILIADANDAGDTRLLRQAGLGWLVLSTRSTDDYVAVAFDTVGTRYEVTLETVRRFLVDGALDGTWDPVEAFTPSSAVFQNGALFVADPAGARVVRFDPITAAQTDFASGLTLVTSIVGDGTNLYASQEFASEISRINASGGISLHRDAPFNVTTLARRGTGEVAFTSPETPFIVSADGPSEFSVLAGGIENAITLTRMGDELLVSDNVNKCLPSPSGPGRAQVIGISAATGVVRLVSNEVCVVAGVVADGGTHAYYADLYGKVVGRFDLATGTRTVVLGTSGGLIAPISVALDRDGDLFVGETDDPTLAAGNARVGRLPAGGGAYDPGFATAVPGRVVVTMRISGEKLWFADVDEPGLFSVPLAGGAVSTEMVDARPAFDGIEADGAGGVYFTDFLGDVGTIRHLSVDGVETFIGGNADPLLALEREANGDLLTSVIVFNDDHDPVVIYSP